VPAPSGREFSPKISFWFLAAVLALFYVPLSAPSPLYSVYEAKFQFSPITLTAIYGVYALAILATLLIAGRLSDHIGRRPLVMVALVVQIVSMFAFITASDVNALYLGRTLQGFSVGLAVGAINAWILDLQPPNHQGLGGLIGSAAAMGGLADGALVSGLLVQYGPDPLDLVFWLLAAVFMIALVAMPMLTDLAVRTPGWLASLKPRIGVPPSARSLFIQMTPSMVGVWALSGLYLSLGPSLVLNLLHSNNHFFGGLVIVTFAGAASLSSILVRGMSPRLGVIVGSLILIAGLGASLLALTTGSVVGFYAGSVITGVGFGPAWTGAFRALAPLAPPDKRGSLLSSIFVVSYLALGVPVIIAGVAITFYGLREATFAYGVGVMALR